MTHVRLLLQVFEMLSKAAEDIKQFQAAVQAEAEEAGIAAPK